MSKYQNTRFREALRTHFLHLCSSVKFWSEKFNQNGEEEYREPSFLSDLCLRSAGKCDIPFSWLYLIEDFIHFPQPHVYHVFSCYCGPAFVSLVPCGCGWRSFSTLAHFQTRGGVSIGQGRTVTIAEEDEGGSRADRLTAVQHSHHLSDMIGKVWKTLENKTKSISWVRKIVYFSVKEIDTSWQLIPKSQLTIPPWLKIVV